MTDQKAHLVQLLRQKSLESGTFTLSSGKTSTYYIDARRTTMSAEGLFVIGELGLAQIIEAGWSVALIGGLTLGADPVSYAVSAASQRSAAPIDAFTVRKAAKDHGTGRLIEGCFTAGRGVVVAEDVITTGGSALTAIEAVRNAGGTVVGVLAVVDRQEGGRELIESAGVDVVTLVTVDELGVAR